jgi:hypothetical protein
MAGAMTPDTGVEPRSHHFNRNILPNIAVFVLHQCAFGNAQITDSVLARWNYGAGIVLDDRVSAFFRLANRVQYGLNVRPRLAG